MRKLSRKLLAVYLAVMVFLYLPIVYLVVQAFLVDPHDWSRGLTLRWVTGLLSSDALWEPLFTSLSIAALSATLAVVVGVTGALGLVGRASRLPGAVQSLILLPILLPEVVTGLSLLLFFLMMRIPLGFWTVVLAHAGFSASFAYFIVLEQLRKLDPQLAEAAQDLGADAGTVFWKVTLPNIVPGMGAAWLFAFTLSFDDFLISFFTSGPTVTTLPLKIYSMMKVGVSPELNALSLFLIAISLFFVTFLVGREHLAKWAHSA
jgi:ABC-type spermidine/putrescine transport system permease subunit II